MISPKDKLPFLDFEILHLYTSYDIACVEASSEFKTLVRTMGDHEPRLEGLISSNSYWCCVFLDPKYIILMVCTPGEKRKQMYIKCTYWH